MPGPDVVTLDLYGQSGQCRLTLSGANLLLSPYNGNRIRINGALYTIPAAGLSLSASGAAANTTYFIYVYDNNGLTLERSTTGHVTNSNGDEVKSGDATRTLVGMARTTSGSAWVDSATQRFMLSWFNRMWKDGRNNFTVDDVTTSSTTYVELRTEVRVEFLTWANEAVQVVVNGGFGNDTISNTLTSIGFDGTTAEDVMAMAGSVAQVVSSIGLKYTKTGLAESYHYATILGRVSAGTGRWRTLSNTASERITLEVAVMG